MRIAVLEDDEAQLMLLVSWLTAAGHEVSSARNGMEFIRLLQKEPFDLLVLDWEVPAYSGLEVLIWVRLRHCRNTPAIVLTQRTAEDDVVTALNAGADDYIRKPPLRTEVLARIESLTRRTRGAAQRVVTLGAFRLDRFAGQVWRGGEEVRLTSTQFALALQFFDHPGEILSRERLYLAIWGRALLVESRTLDAHVSNLRAKLGLRVENGVRLSTVYGYGYRLEAAHGPDAPAR